MKAAENRFHYETEEFFKLAAAYAYHLSQVHAFLDENKRIAAAVLTIFLEINNWTLATSTTNLLNYS